MENNSYDHYNGPFSRFYIKHFPWTDLGDIYLLHKVKESGGETASRVDLRDGTVWKLE